MTRRYRFAVPVVVAGLIGLGAWIPTITAAASPDLPAISPSALISKVVSERVTHLSGTIQWAADLGLPSLSGLTSGDGQDVSSDSGFDPTSLLTGTQDFGVWIDGATRQRIAEPGTLQENDLVRNGNQVWSWDSATGHVAHTIVAAPTKVYPGRVPQAGGQTSAAVSTPVGSINSVYSVHTSRASREYAALTHAEGVGGAGPGYKPSSVFTNSGLQQVSNNGSAFSVAPFVPPADNPQTYTPQGIAASMLGGLRASTTSVSVSRAVRVAGRSAYVLRLAPERGLAANRGSTVSSVDIAVDAKTGLVLRVAVYAVGQASPALQIGFTSIDYSAPAAADLAAPKGLTTSTKVIHPQSSSAEPTTGAATSMIGADWGTIFNLPGADTASASTQELQTATTAASGRWGSGRLLRSTLVNALFLPDGRVLVGFATPAAIEQAAGRLAS